MSRAQHRTVAPVAALVATLVLAAGVLVVAGRTDRASASAPTAVNTIGCAGKTFALNGTGQSVLVIDQHTNTVAATVPLGIDAQMSALSSDGSILAVSSYTQAVVKFVHLFTGQITTLTTTSIPSTIALSPDGSTLYLATDHTVEKWDVTSSTLVATSQPMGGTPTRWINAVIVSPDGSALWVVDRDGSSPALVHKLDTGSMAETGSTPLPGNEAYGAAIAPDGHTLYVPLADTGRVVAVDTTSFTTTSFGSFINPSAVAVSPDGSVLVPVTLGMVPIRAFFVTTFNLQTTGFADDPNGYIQLSVTIDASSSYAYTAMANYANGHVGVFDLATQQFVTAIPVPGLDGDVFACPRFTDPTPSTTTSAAVTTSSTASPSATASSTTIDAPSDPVAPTYAH